MLKLRREASRMGSGRAGSTPMRLRAQGGSLPNMVARQGHEERPQEPQVRIAAAAYRNCRSTSHSACCRGHSCCTRPARQGSGARRMHHHDTSAHTRTCHDHTCRGPSSAAGRCPSHTDRQCSPRRRDTAPSGAATRLGPSSTCAWKQRPSWARSPPSSRHR